MISSNNVDTGVSANGVTQYIFIVNPKAGRGAGRRVVPSLERALKRLRLDYILAVTEGPGHAREIANSSKGQVVVAVGGDGTANEVANGLLGTGKIMGIIPTGSGNDLVRSLGIPRDLGKALQVLERGTLQTIDIGRVECAVTGAVAAQSGNSTDRYFVNAVGVGFDAAVAERTRHLKYVSGTALYLIALFQTLWKYRPPEFTMRTESAMASARKFLIAVGNGKCVGGGFYLTPDAEMDDGHFDTCTVDALSIPSIIRLIPKVLTANHRNSKGISLSTAREIMISSSDRFYVHADGELVGENVNEVRISLIKKGLQVIKG